MVIFLQYHFFNQDSKEHANDFMEKRRHLLPAIYNYNMERFHWEPENIIPVIGAAQAICNNVEDDSFSDESNVENSQSRIENNENPLFDVENGIFESTTTENEHGELKYYIDYHYILILNVFLIY